MKILDIDAPRVQAEKIGPDLWQLSKNYKASYRTDEGVYVWFISKGFKTNFRSGSSIINWIIPKRGKFGPMFVVHDACYNDKGEGISRKLSDKLLALACRFRKMSGWKVNLMRQAVTLFGKPAFSDSQKHLVKFYLVDK